MVNKTGKDNNYDVGKYSGNMPALPPERGVMPNGGIGCNRSYAGFAPLVNCAVGKSQGKVGRRADPE
jgi:hypothetical protein